MQTQLSTRPNVHLACRAFVVLVAIMCGGNDAAAHEGPPFPLMIDEPLSGHKVSIWADPDIGEAKFFIIVESVDDQLPKLIPNVSMWTEPVSGRLERVTYEPELQAQRSHLQFVTHPMFDIRDTWRIGVNVSFPNGEPGSIMTEVESTPPGFGVWDLAIYLFPFVLFGGMWAFAMVRRRRAWLEQPDTEPLNNIQVH